MSIDWSQFPAAIWRAKKELLKPVSAIDPVGLDDLTGIDRQKQALVENTERFLRGVPANNALLWGARGTGKSSLIKAILNHYHTRNLRMIEVDKNDLVHLHDIVDDLRARSYRFVIYCDDLSFEANETGYKALKSVLEGSLELPPENVKIYATSNRRHLMPEYMSENRASGLVEGELHYADAIEEKISLSDRFGLWLSFYPFTQDEYLAIVDSYFPDYKGDRDALRQAALQFAQGRGARSGRTARQFFNVFSGGSQTV
jgi:predicted AAA+ superfamily ATPase